jgi:hypothetical protein
VNNVSNDLLPFMVGQSQDSLILLGSQGWDVISALSAGDQSAMYMYGVKTGGTLKQTRVSSNIFLCPGASVELQKEKAEILDGCHSHQCRSFMSLSKVNPYAAGNGLCLSLSLVRAKCM